MGLQQQQTKYKKMSIKQPLNTTTQTNQQSEQSNPNPNPNPNTNLTQGQPAPVPHSQLNNEHSRSKQRERYRVCGKEEESVGVNRQIWRKLRMIKEWQGCGLCRRGLGVLLGVGRGYGQGRDWVVMLAQLKVNQIAAQRQQQQGDSMDRNKHWQLAPYPESLSTLKTLTHYYRYYQYMPATPSQPSQNPQFQILKSYFNTQTELIYLKLKLQLQEQLPNSVRSLSSVQDSLDMEVEIDREVYENFMKESRSVEQGEEEGEGVGDGDGGSVCELLGEMGESRTNLFLAGFENSLIKKQKNKPTKQKTSKPKQKAPLKTKTASMKSKTKSKNKPKPTADDKPSTKLLTLPHTSLTKLKKKKINMSCGNLPNSSPNFPQTKPKAKPQTHYKGSHTNSQTKKIQSARASLSGKKKLTNSVTLNIKDYISDLKRKINMDKEQYRASYYGHGLDVKDGSLEPDAKRDRNVEVSCFNSTSSKIYTSSTYKNCGGDEAQGSKKRKDKPQLKEKRTTKLKTKQGKDKQKQTRQFWTCSYNQLAKQPQQKHGQSKRKQPKVKNKETVRKAGTNLRTAALTKTQKYTLNNIHSSITTEF